MTSSINAGVNQTFSVTLLVAMIHMVVNEALLFNTWPMDYKGVNTETPSPSHAHYTDMSLLHVKQPES